MWGFTDAEIDALRYFVCQTREENFNPSLNKSIYFWSEKKQTGKTSVARALASVLNGGTSVIDGGNYESTFSVELQLNPHDLPASCKYNCVILDEAMPKDSSKSYGRVKSMLTSNNVTYNQKFSRIQNLKAKRFYLFTSNEDIRQLIQDDSERRLIEIQMNDRPVQISFEEIYSIWKNSLKIASLKKTGKSGITHLITWRGWRDWTSTTFITKWLIMTRFCNP